MSTDRNAERDRLLNDAKPEIAAHWESCRECGLEAATEAATGQAMRASPPFSNG